MSHSFSGPATLFRCKHQMKCGIEMNGPTESNHEADNVHGCRYSSSRIRRFNTVNTHQSPSL